MEQGIPRNVLCDQVQGHNVKVHYVALQSWITMLWSSMKYKQITGEYYDTILNYVLIWAYYKILWAWHVTLLSKIRFCCCSYNINGQNQTKIHGNERNATQNCPIIKNVGILDANMTQAQHIWH